MFVPTRLFVPIVVSTSCFRFYYAEHVLSGAVLVPGVGPGGGDPHYPPLPRPAPQHLRHRGDILYLEPLAVLNCQHLLQILHHAMGARCRVGALRHVTASYTFYSPKPLNYE